MDYERILFMKIDEQTKEYLRQSGLKKKIQFFFDYYTWQTIGIIALLIFVVSMIVNIITAKKPLLYIVLINSVMEEENCTEISDNYLADNGINPDKFKLDIDPGYAHVKPSENPEDYDELANATVQKYQVMILSEEIDITISPDWAIDLYEQSDWYYNLKDFLPEDLYKKVEDRLYYSKDSTGASIPVGISLDGISCIDDCYETATPILTVSAFTNNPEESINFINWLFK